MKTEDDMTDKIYVVRKNGMFYRPDSRGYTTSIHEAGRYNEVEATWEAMADGVTKHEIEEFLMSEVTVDDFKTELHDLLSAREITAEEASAKIVKFMRDFSHACEVVAARPGDTHGEVVVEIRLPPPLRSVVMSDDFADAILTEDDGS